MMLVRNRTLSPIGIDIGHRFIKAVQLKQQGGSQTVYAHALLERSTDATSFGVDEALRLTEVLLRRGFAGSRIVLAAPTDKLACEMLDLPPRKSGAPIEQIARAEISRAATFGESAFEMGMWDLPTPPRANAGTSVMTIALREDDAEAELAPFDAARLDVLAIEAPIMALARACHVATGSPEQSLIVLEIGCANSSLVLLSGGLALYQRRFPEMGLGSLCREISGKFELTNEATEFLICEQGDAQSPLPQQGDRWQWIRDQIKRFAERMAEEVHTSLTYVAQRYPDLKSQKLLISGGGANVVGLCDALRSHTALSVDAITANDMALSFSHPAVSFPAMRFVIAVGLARRGANK